MPSGILNSPFSDSERISSTNSSATEDAGYSICSDDISSLDGFMCIVFRTERRSLRRTLVNAGLALERVGGKDFVSPTAAAHLFKS